MNEKKKHYLIYLTTNLVNGKIYIGKHETTNIEDDYFGSGNLIRAAINKYGLENFVKTILFELLNEEEMNLLEKCVVTLEFCDREDTYNINVGGDGGWSYVNTKIWNFNKKSLALKKRFLNEEERIKIGKISSKFLKTHPDILRKILASALNAKRENIKKDPNYYKGVNGARYGMKNSKHARQAISDAMKTDKNFMKGAKYYVNFELKQTIILHNGDSIPEGFVKGRCYDFEKHELNLKKQEENKQIKANKILQKQEEKLKRLIQKNIEKLQKIENHKRHLYEMLQWYWKFGWKSMVDQFNYTHTLQAFSLLILKYFNISMSGRKLKNRQMTSSSEDSSL